MPPQDVSVPGVYIDEIPSQTPSIEGVATTTTAFAGPTLSGPADAIPALITSFVQFQTLYGDASDLTFTNGQTPPLHNYMFSAARSFFENGGARLYIARVAAAAGQGAPPTADDYRAALSTLEPLTDISIVAAPGSTVFAGSTPAQVAAIHAELITHVSRPAAFRFAVLDPPPGASTAGIQAIRAAIDSPYAALYYPWITISDPHTPAAQISIPPSGSVCGIYARTDIQQGVFKPPAGQALLGALGLERTIADPESTTLNDLGINTLRTFPGRGNLVWGARTISSDSDWKYVNVRRLFIYLEASIDKGIQWAIFEPNDTLLWDALTSRISSFLLTEWRRGALQGLTPAEAFYVKCDRTTMNQNDLDNGRLICLVGIAPARPAEFVVFRIQIQTSDTKNP